MWVWVSVATGLAVAALVTAGVLLRRLRQEETLRHRMAQEMQAMVRLAASLDGHDWNQSEADLLGAIVAGGFGRGAVLLVTDESGAVSMRQRVWPEDDLRWQRLLTAPEVRYALTSRAPATVGEIVLLPFVRTDDELSGVLAVWGGNPASPALRAASRLAELSLMGARLSGKQATISNTDGLTGLANHRHFQQMLGAALGQVYLEGEPLALILLDIDRFKHINDTYGHLLGDLVIKEIARTVRTHMPRGAFAARYGGEEMAVMLQGVDALRATEVAEELRQAVEKQEMMDFTSGVKIKVTVSLGVSCYELGEGKTRLVARADEAMYASKHAGRNCVTVAEAKEGTKTSFPA